MKLLVLIISSDTFPVYAQHRDVWRSYMKRHPEVDCYFIHYSPLTFVPSLTSDTLTMRGLERYRTILAKTLDAMAYCLPRGPYTHVVRTNLSSVWDFPKLLTRLATLPTTRLYAGVPCDTGTASGAGILLSRDVADLLVANRRTVLSLGVVDDVVIGAFLLRTGIPLLVTPRVDFRSLAHYRETHAQSVPSDAFHYRVKHWNYEHERLEEPETMRCILRDHIYTSPNQ